ncbi:hypothetical protein O1611_g4163 [Lasiodiplodia mahajangana]|uniref:Uncharacterized protein n=1 Tax=Lasiodiplodia mahajangana TaxID=1108764 RepID=A0ACC2JPP1_9PEZI|nr:hypothetical protein O1611_g4163 [Lasiodiplodia mahajangana]
MSPSFKMEESSSTSESRMPADKDYAEETYEMARPSSRGDRPGVLLFDSRFLTAEHLRFYNMRVSNFAFALVHPTAVKLELINCTWDLITEIPVSKNVAARAIHLVDTKIGDDGFNDILTNFPNLRTLVYCRPTDDVDTQFDMIGREIKLYGQRLEHLTLLNESYMPFCTPIGSLQALDNLKSLDIYLEMLIGFLRNPGDYDDYMDSGFNDSDEECDYDEIYDEEVGDWSLIKMLPGTLESLTLHIEDAKLHTYFNTYERYGAKIEELITADHLFPNLRSISAPRLSQVAKKLSGDQTAWALTNSTMHRVPLAVKAEGEAAAELKLAEFQGEPWLS